MIEQIYAYFTIEILYFWVNLGVLPFWLILIFFPQSNLSKYFVTSVFPIILLGGTYIFVLYKSYLNSYDFVSNFELYLSISNLSIYFQMSFFSCCFGYILFQLIYLLVAGLLGTLKNFLSIKFLLVYL